MKIDFVVVAQLAIPFIFLALATPNRLPKDTKILFIVLAFITVAFYGGCAMVATGFGKAFSGGGSANLSSSDARLFSAWLLIVIVWSVIILSRPNDKNGSK